MLTSRVRVINKCRPYKYEFETIKIRSMRSEIRINKGVLLGEWGVAEDREHLPQIILNQKKQYVEDNQPILEQIELN